MSKKYPKQVSEGSGGREGRPGEGVKEAEKRDGAEQGERVSRARLP